MNIDFKTPVKWSDLNDSDLRYLFRLIAAGLDSAEIKVLFLFKRNKCKLIGKCADNSWLCKMQKQFFRVSALQVAEIIGVLDWIDQPGIEPVRISKIGKYEAPAADFQEVPFGNYLICENLYQGYIQTSDSALLKQMIDVLYGPGLSPTEAECISVFYWFSSVKVLLATTFKDFFQPPAEDGNLLGPGASQAQQLQESMNAQIRALTKGDVTKENQILTLDTWRVLTELNAQAKEYRELNAKLNKK